MGLWEQCKQIPVLGDSINTDRTTESTKREPEWDCEDASNRGGMITSSIVNVRLNIG